MLCNKLTQQKYIMQQASALLPLDSLKLLYYSYIDSNISYGVLVWGSMISKESTDQLECKQKRVISIIRRMNKGMVLLLNLRKWHLII